MADEVSALFDFIGKPLRRSTCVVTSVSPLTITFHGQPGVLAEKISGSTVTTGTAYVFYTDAPGRPLVIQTV